MIAPQAAPRPVSDASPAEAGPPAVRARMGQLAFDCLSFEQALAAIAQLVARGRAATVFTPNVDHVVLAESDSRFREAYAAASLALVDGTPLFWALRLLGWPVPAKVSGSDLMLPLMGLAAQSRWRVYFLGGGPGVGELAAKKLRERFPELTIVGIEAPAIDMSEAASQRSAIVERCRQAQPDVVVVALGTPKGELMADELCQALDAPVVLSLGASLDFVAGTQRRAPALVSRLGLEWLYRLILEPRRLWRRYLVRDAAFLPIFLRAARSQRAPRDRS
jgi:N-acetylglucosaminyldiphosphoundecaprenol N-acetyl-beta-D-mannosaminyltransferase